MTGHLHRPLLADQQGATIVEFALILPPMLLTLIGLFDMAHNMYTAQVLTGVVQQAARNSTIEGAKINAPQQDTMVTKAVRQIAPGAKVQVQRLAYRDFAAVGRPEQWTDLNKDGKCNNGEPFEDINGNKKWDKKPGTGVGGAGEAVLYTVTITYNRLFPITAVLPGQSTTMKMSTSTVLRNQPYAIGQQAPTTTRNCT